MIREVYQNLFLADDSICFPAQILPVPDILQTPHATIHATKFPCHARVLKYKGSLPKDHPHYLIYERGLDLYLNMIDPDLPLFKPELFWTATEFIERYIREMPVIIHCNAGQSRSPSLALIYLVKNGISPFPKDKYFENDQWLLSLYDLYSPGRGITSYLREHWMELINGRVNLPEAS